MRQQKKSPTIRDVITTHDFLNRHYDNVLEQTNSLYDMGEDFRLLDAKREHFIALDIVIDDEKTVDELFNDYIEDNTVGGPFSGPSRKQIDTALIYIDDYNREEFLRNFHKKTKQRI